MSAEAATFFGCGEFSVFGQNHNILWSEKNFFKYFVISSCKNHKM